MITRIIDLPYGIKGATVKDAEGDYNVYINARYSGDIQVTAFRHELEHIKNGDFYTEDPVYIKEAKNRF